MGKNYYEILGVPENASDAEIEAAFKVKAREVHPDTVPADNAYLRKVASEAFKDLSEAKAALLDPTTRQKFDASLAVERERNRESSTSSTSTSSSTSESSDNSSPNRTRTGSRTGSSRRTQSIPSRARTGSSPFPEIRNLNSFLFMVLGMATIFFLAVLVASGRMPPLWLAIVTAAIGILLFVNGMRPVRPFTSGRPTLIGSAVVVTCILLALWLVSPSYFEMATTSRIANAVATRARRVTQSPSSPKVLADGSANEVVDESTPEAQLPTRIWSNLKDGQNYRSRVDGTTLYLDAIASGGKISGQFAGCEFHRTGTGPSDWVGMCTELGGNGEALRKLPATLNRFSEDRIEGSTADIPVFVMTPIDTVQMATNAVPNTNATSTVPGTSPIAGADPSTLAIPGKSSGGSTTPGSNGSGADPANTTTPATSGEIQPTPQDTTEPDLSALKKSDQEAVQLTCASERLSQGVTKYNECLRKQLDALKAMPNPPSLAGLSAAEREDVVLTCSNEKLIHGPGAYNACLVQQLKKKRKLK
ncbi:MAG: J domain-containing protein [Acidobacteria bacterium]|nr:J domain-containing protein [Acidobacteriota bacterium]